MLNKKLPRAMATSRSGLSMMEVVVSMTLVATIMLVSLSASANMMRNRTVSRRAIEAQVLAGYFLDEISTLPFWEPVDPPVFGPEPGERSDDRTTFDDIDDFHGYRSSAMVFRDGQTIDGFNGWSVRTDIYSLALAGSTLRNAPHSTAVFRLIGVTVTDPDGTPSTYRTLVSLTPTDRLPTQSYERMRRIELNFSEDRKVNAVIPLRNTPTPAY